MTSQTSRTLEAVARIISLMLCASVSYAQGPTGEYQATKGSPTEPLLVVCRAEVPARHAAYVSAAFVAHPISRAQKEFRKLVTAQYGAVGQVPCAGPFYGAVVKSIVQQWKDEARATNTVIVETDWAPSIATVVAPL